VRPQRRRAGKAGAGFPKAAPDKAQPSGGPKRLHRFPRSLAHIARLLTEEPLSFPRGMKRALRSSGRQSDASLCRCKGQFPGRRRTPVASRSMRIVLNQS